MLGKRTQMLVCSPCTLATRSWGTHAGVGSFLAESSGERTPKVTCLGEHPAGLSRGSCAIFTGNALNCPDRKSFGRNCWVQGGGTSECWNRAAGQPRRPQTALHGATPSSPTSRDTHARTREGWGMLFAPLWLCPTDSNHLSVLNTL